MYRGLLCVALIVSSAVHAEVTLEIAGTGDSQALLLHLEPVFEAQYPGVDVVVPYSIGSGGGIRALRNKQIHLARTARPLTELEKKDLVEYPFALSPVVFAAHPSVDGLQNLAFGQVLSIYQGRTRDWAKLGGPAHKIYAIGREPNDSSRRIIEAAFPNFKARSDVVKVIYNTPETVDAVVRHPYTLAYMPLAVAREAGLRVLAFEGFEPSHDNVLSESYPLINRFYVVSRPAPEGVTKAFIDFLYSDAARRVMVDHSVFPITTSGN